MSDHTNSFNHTHLWKYTILGTFFCVCLITSRPRDKTNCNVFITTKYSVYSIKHKRVIIYKSYSKIKGA